MSAWWLTKQARFEASHVLPRQGGKCARLHGHSWTVEIEAAGYALQESGTRSGMVMDFADIGGPLKRLVEASLDHYHLNETTGLPDPTSEALARWIYERLAPEIPALSAVSVRETCTSCVEYRP